MLTWVNILHLHQPPHQDEAVVKKVADESYRLILSLLKRYQNAKFTINISGSLMELLQKYGCGDVIDGTAHFVRLGRVELTASAMYHPIMPLIPYDEAERQIDEFMELFVRTFPDIPKPNGFFLPEMAYSRRVAELVVKKGFSWIALDEKHLPAGKTGSATQPTNNTVRYRVAGLSLNTLFRNRTISRHFPPEAIFSYLKPETENSTLITAHDGELYGHWHRDDRGFYEKVFTDPVIRCELVSSYLASLAREEEIEPKEISWETLEEDERCGAPYALWHHPDNQIHKLMWEFTELCRRAVREHGNDPNAVAARRRFDRGMTSCGWWWMSGRKIGPFSPVCWHPSETKKTLDELLASTQLLTTLPLQERQAAENAYKHLVSLIFDTHEKIKHKS